MAEYPKKPDRPTLYRFRLQAIVGRGGTGTVYRAIDPESGNTVALKLFHANFFRNRWHQMDLRRTAKRFKKLDHPNVVKVFDFISGNEGDVLVQEFVDGPDLQWYVQNRPYNADEMLVIAVQIVNGLGYLHDQGLMHHDLKPGNVLFTRKGQAKLCDFSLGGTGFLLSVFDRSKAEQITPMYVAPELIKKQRVTKLSDMYSLGGVFYFMFTRKLPFAVDSLPKLYHAHLYDAPLHPTVANDKCPRVVGDAIMRLLEKDPKKRFQDCDSLRVQLSDVGKRRI
jgi:serine/threonine-protein kinase